MKIQTYRENGSRSTFRPPVKSIPRLETFLGHRYAREFERPDVAVLLSNRKTFQCRASPKNTLQPATKGCLSRRLSFASFFLSVQLHSSTCDHVGLLRADEALVWWIIRSRVRIIMCRRTSTSNIIRTTCHKLIHKILCKCANQRSVY